MSADCWRRRVAESDFPVEPRTQICAGELFWQEISPNLPVTYTFQIVKLTKKERHKSVHITLLLIFGLVMH